ncbi:MAG: SRPBCC family protein [Hyphomicrobiaceae bacterium]|nr:SRPBCC family protein [Hyphomicrobiaceae bacterium]
MPTVAEKITIPSPPALVWPLLSDPALVASCIPGATLAPDQDGGDVWKGSIRVKFGPTVAVFRGEATLSYDHGNMRCTIDGRGIDQRGASRALAHGIVSATGSTETELALEGEYTVTGPLETFANAGGVHVARALLAEFAKNMGSLVAERHVGASQAAPAGTPAAAPGTAAPAPSGAAPASATAMPAPATSGATAPASAGPPASAPSRAPPRPAAELNAFSLLWAAFKSWLSSLFGKRS